MRPVAATATIAAILGATCAGEVVAQNATGPTAANATDADDPNTRIVCRRYPPPVGSRIGARNICKTEREWQQIDAEQRYVIDRVRNMTECPGTQSGRC